MVKFKNLFKLDIGKDPNLLYIGGVGLYTKSIDPTKKDVKEIIPKVVITWFKVMEKYIVIQESSTYNLLIYDINTLALLNKLPGTAGPCTDKEALRSCAYVNDDKFMIWMKGASTISIVNSKDPVQSHTEIKGFFGGSGIIPISAVVSRDGTRTAGLAAQGYEMNLCFWNTGAKKPTIVQCNKIYTECKLLFVSI